MNDNSIMPFGKYKGNSMANVPDSYLVWIWGQNKDRYLGNPDMLKSINDETYNVMKYIEEFLYDQI
jgi:uncharacterized protein (DUF3820 family)